MKTCLLAGKSKKVGSKGQFLPVPDRAGFSQLKKFKSLHS
jgi:hypothetical protein